MPFLKNLGVLLLGVVCGWSMCCILTAGKFSDMETEMQLLREDRKTFKFDRRGDADVRN